MTYNDYYEFEQKLHKERDKLQKQYDTVDACYEKTQMNSVAIERNHIAALIDAVDDTLTQLEYFTQCGA